MNADEWNKQNVRVVKKNERNRTESLQVVETKQITALHFSEPR